MNLSSGVDTLDNAELLRLRMIAQGLVPSTAARHTATDSVFKQAGRESDRVAATARRMLAVQGQDWRSARWALGVRTAGASVDDVHEAFNNGSLVRSWPMRSTVHLLAAEDIGWIQAVTNHRVFAGAAKRREFLGLSDTVLDQLVETSITALRGGAQLDREELADIWTEAGIEWRSNWRYHVIWWLCQNGLAVFGPVADTGEPKLVAASEWITHPRKLAGDEARAELAARYASARGAVSAKDFAWWTGLTAREARQGLSDATDQGLLTAVMHTSSAGSVGNTPRGAGGRAPDKTAQLWADPLMLEQALLAHGTLRDEDHWLLLPAFDEHLLGYQDRSAQLAPEHFEHIVPGRNGMFLATIVHAGRVVGTWKRGKRKGEGLVGTPLPGEHIDATAAPITQRVSQWANFHQLDETSFVTAGA